MSQPPTTPTRGTGPFPDRPAAEKAAGIYAARDRRSYGVWCTGPERFQIDPYVPDDERHDQFVSLVKKDGAAFYFHAEQWHRR